MRYGKGSIELNPDYDEEILRRVLRSGFISNEQLVRFLDTVLKATISGPTPPIMKNVGSMAQLAVGGSWQTTLVLVNSGTTPAQAQLHFFDNNGNALLLPLTFPQSAAADLILASTLDRTPGAGASLAIQGGGSENQPLQVGWAQLLSDGGVSGFAIFRRILGDQVQGATVPLETRSGGY